MMTVAPPLAPSTVSLAGLMPFRTALSAASLLFTPASESSALRDARLVPLFEPTALGLVGLMSFLACVHWAEGRVRRNRRFLHAHHQISEGKLPQLELFGRARVLLERSAQREEPQRLA